MGRIVIDNSRCKSCYICTMTCPKGLIKKSDKTNRLGDYMVEFDDKNGCSYIFSFIANLYESVFLIISR